MTIDNGGPAFPMPGYSPRPTGERPHISACPSATGSRGKPLQGRRSPFCPPTSSGTPQIAAELAYQIADAMLKERAGDK